MSVISLLYRGTVYYEAGEELSGRQPTGRIVQPWGALRRSGVPRDLQQLARGALQPPGRRIVVAQEADQASDIQDAGLQSTAMVRGQLPDDR